MMNKKLLIIDDDQDLREMLVELLSTELSDFEILEADDGDIGLNKIKSCSPDVVICDNNMPKMKGVEVVHQLNLQNINVPKFFLHTGDCHPPQLNLQGKEVAVWHKPKNFLELVATITKD